MSIPNADAAREAARQDNGQFGTQPRNEVVVDLADAPKGCFGCGHAHNDNEDGRCWEVSCVAGCPACAELAAERDATIAVHQDNEARLDAQYAADDEAGAKDYMAFMDPGAPPEPETFGCAECGESLIADPDGSPGVLVHIDEDGNRDYDADESHAGIDENQVEAVFGQNVAYPNGRCPACGFGLDEGGLCYQVDCSRFDVNSAYAEEGHTTSGDEAEWVTAAELSVGDRLIEGTVTSIDNDHKSTSIELDNDPETIAEYANDERVARYVSEDEDDPELRECGDDCVEHASWCDGYCTHTATHRNACLDVPAAERPLTSANRDHRPHPDLADEDVKEAYRA